MDFSLTPYQRLNLFNQYTILEKLSLLQKNEVEAKIFAEKANVVMEGYVYSYHMCTEVIQEELSEKDCKLVWDTLEMYSSMLLSFRKMNNPKINEMDIRFPGFDGNYEAKLLSYCGFILFDLDRYNEFTEDGRKDFNSHFPYRETYRARIQKWDDMGRPDQLTEDQIILLIKK